jgi:hypothetical protein
MVLKNKLKFKLILLISSLVIIPLVSSCTTPPYKTYSLKHYDYQFSFDYPSGYKNIQSYIQKNPDAPLSVRFARDSENIVFGISISSPHTENRTPAEAANIAGSHSPEQELERSSVTIAGISGELVAYSYTSQDSPMVDRTIFFDAYGTLWHIFIYSHPEKAEEAKLDFDHIIQTFKLGENN